MPVVTKELTAPSGLRATIRKLSYWHVRQAKRAFLSDVIQQGKEMGDLSDRVQAARKAADEEAMRAGLPLPSAVEAAKQADLWDAYDQQITLHKGLVSWSYEEQLSDATIDELLDAPDADFLFHEIVLFSERSDAERKDSAAASPLTSEPVVDLGPAS